MKKAVALFLIVVMLMANSYAAVVEVNIDGIKVNSLRDNETRTILLEEVPFVNESGRTMVPIRAISESFGAEVSWDGEKNEVKIISGEDTILLTIDNNIALLNGEEITLDSAPLIKGGRTFVPLRFIGESFGYNINYAESTRQVIIDDTDIVLKAGNVTFTFAELEALYNIYYQLNYASAKNYGATEEEMAAAALYSALEIAYSIVVICNTFPEAKLDAKDVQNITDSIKQDEAYFTLPLSGLSALMHEKLYYSKGSPALYTLAQTSEVKEIYEKNYVCAKHILVDDEETAKELIAMLEGGADFDELVKTYGKDPGMTVNKDGYIFTYGEMVKEFEDAAFELAIGGISAPVKSDYGYHIIKREALPEIGEETALRLANGIAREKLAEAVEPELLISQEELLKRLG